VDEAVQGIRWLDPFEQRGSDQDVVQFERVLDKQRVLIRFFAGPSGLANIQPDAIQVLYARSAEGILVG